MSTSTVKRNAVAVQPAAARAARFEDRRLYFFLLLQFACQSALIVERIGGLRSYFRALTFFSSLAMLVLVNGSARRGHPAAALASLIVLITGIGLLHPDTNFMSGLAQTILTIAIWSPLIWVGRIKITPHTLWNAMLLLWGFHFASTIVGVLQVYFPARFSPSADFVKSLLGSFSDGLLVELADGNRVWRPFGLSDSPGGAAVSAGFAISVGLIILLSKERPRLRLLAAIGIVTGIFCLYLCETRSLIATTVISVGAITLIEIMRGRLSRIAGLTLFVPFIVGGGIAWTQFVGGEASQKRVRSLADASTAGTFYKSRGRFVEHSLTTDLTKYPLGAGVGRYGMMYNYFGDRRSVALWVEVQITAWLYDGGLLLVVLGYSTLIIACYISFRLALDKKLDRRISDCAAIVAGINISTLALTFSYPFFTSQAAIIFWLLNGAVYAAAVQSQGRGMSLLPSRARA